MMYLDNGVGDPREQALFHWLKQVLTESVVQILWQSGYFDESVLALFRPTLLRLAKKDQNCAVLIGSNDGVTRSDTVHQLVRYLGLPRSNAHLGVIRYDDGLFHSKTIHVRYDKGREVAYVGSSNLTKSGINGLNIETGIVLDSDHGDSEDLLSQISAAVYRWFDVIPEGLFEIKCHEDVNSLESQGVISADCTANITSSDRACHTGTLPKRRYHHRIPSIDPSNREESTTEVANVEHRLRGEVLLTELAGPGRWAQAAFPQWFIHEFFQVLPGTGEVIQLIPISSVKGIGLTEERRCGHKPGSKNWYFELGIAAEIGDYPRQGLKPIGIFHKTDHQIFRYTILLPNDHSYELVSNFLLANRGRLNRPSNELSRTIVPVQELYNSWNANWFFDT